MKTYPARPIQLPLQGFTMIEMMTVLGIIGILLSLILPVLSRARGRADEARCISNASQLALAWTLYCGDFADKLPPNIDGAFGGFTNWVAGTMQDDPRNAALLVDPRRSLLGTYLRSPAVFRCPADDTPHVRSVAMNCRLNPTREIGVPPRWVGGAGESYWTFRSLAEIGKPSEVFLILDENPTSINDAYFAVDMSNSGTFEGIGECTPYFIIDHPAGNHDGGATVSFADGHVLVHRWKETSTLEDIHPLKHVLPPHRDAEWLQAHCTYRR